MKTFLIEFDYGECHCECYVQKLSSKSEPVYILNFRDTFLIRKFNGKKILLAGKATNAGTSQDVVFEQHAWNAIIQQENHQPKGTRSFMRRVNLRYFIGVIS